jgi:hypothetical protein
MSDTTAGIVFIPALIIALGLAYRPRLVAVTLADQVGSVR